MTDFTPVYDVENPPLSHARESRVSDFWALLKPRVMSLVVFSGFAGMWVAPGFDKMHPLLIIVSIITLALGAGAAGAINMWYDRDIDQVMKRTQSRPVPAGRVEPSEALSFALFMTVAAVLTMGVALNWVAAGILAFATFFYAVIYTMWLKRHTPQNIVIGGAAGAFPPMIGWACVTGDVTLMPILLFTIIFLWTPPHFWALSLFACEDYKKAGIPMLPAVAGPDSTKKQMLVYTLLLLPVTLTPFMLGYSGWLYGISALLLSGFFVFTALKVMKDPTLKSARLMFGYSVFYLFALFLALMIDAA
ncbi:MAG: heme o synthase [Micavibrio sp.]